MTTLSTALALVWPGAKVLLEADTSGADLPFRMRREDTGSWLAPDPSIGSLAAVARLGPPVGGLASYGQLSSLGISVIPGALSAERFGPLKPLWPHLAQVLARWSGTVVADLGRFQPGHPALPVAKASAVVLLLARADLAGFFHLRERVSQLAQAVGDPAQGMNPVAVVVTGPAKQRSRALAEAAALLGSIGSPVPVAGFVPHDLKGAEDLWAGQVTRRLAGSELIRAARHLAEQLLTARPEIAPAAAPPPAEPAAVPWRGGTGAVLPPSEPSATPATPPATPVAETRSTATPSEPSEAARRLEEGVAR